MNTRGFTIDPGVYNPVNNTPIRGKAGLLPPNIASKLYHGQTWRVKGYRSKINKSKVTPASTPSFSAQYGRGRKKHHSKKRLSRYEVSGGLE
jgi:hypothetical protein